jgi:hypothetical protein
MGLGSSVGNGAFTLATDLSTAAFGILCLITVVCGLIIITNIGGQGIQKILRSYIFGIILGTIFTGAFSRVASGMQGLFR